MIDYYFWDRSSCSYANFYLSALDYFSFQCLTVSTILSILLMPFYKVALHFWDSASKPSYIPFNFKVVFLTAST